MLYTVPWQNDQGTLQNAHVEYWNHIQDQLVVIFEYRPFFLAVYYSLKKQDVKYDTKEKIILYTAAYDDTQWTLQ